MKYIKKICLLAGTALLGCALICGCGAKNEPDPTVPVTVPVVSDTKQPSEYTWQEYLAMTGEEQMEFQKSFGSPAVFDAWMEAALREDTKLVCPWDADGAKQPAEYTWEEFEALSGEYQIAFQKALGEEAFEAWMNEARSQPEEGTGVPDSATQPEEHPWDADGAKQPEEYTWEEFEALSGEHQIAFQNYMGEEAFAAWMDQAQNQPAEYPWDAPGAKQPEDYTWAEFEALSGAHQIEFQKALGMEAFDAWLNRVNP